MSLCLKVSVAIPEHALPGRVDMTFDNPRSVDDSRDEVCGVNEPTEVNLAKKQETIGAQPTIDQGNSPPLDAAEPQIPSRELTETYSVDETKYSNGKRRQSNIGTPVTDSPSKSSGSEEQSPATTRYTAPTTPSAFSRLPSPAIRAGVSATM